MNKIKQTTNKIVKKIVFVKPMLETDAVFDPIRTCSYLGIWYMASKLKELGHEVHYLDEVVRNNGLSKKQMYIRTLDGNRIIEEKLAISYEEFETQKMKDYKELSPKEFVKKYTAFKDDGKIVRMIVKTGNGEEETLNELEKINPDFVCIPLIATANYLCATKLGIRIKKEMPKAKIIFGGQHISANPIEFLNENSYVDHIITGDAINVIDKLVDGTINERIINGGFQNMEKFPLLDQKIIEHNGYPKNPTYSYPTNGRKYADFMFSKGCFRKCDFCVAGCQKSNHVTTNAYEKTDAQLKLLKQEGVRELIIQDDAFLWDKVHVKEHLPKILALMKKYGFYWQNNGGIEFEGMDDFVTQLFIDYNKSGEGKITSLYIPFNPRSWNKNESAAKSMSQKYHDNLYNLKKLREEAGIYIFTSAIIGTPEQTQEAFDEELATDKQLILEGFIDAALPLSATMLPGTKWYASNENNIASKKDYPGFSLFTTHHKTEFFDSKKIEELMVRWVKELDSVQKTYAWGSAFANST